MNPAQHSRPVCHRQATKIFHHKDTKDTKKSKKATKEIFVLFVSLWFIKNFAKKAMFCKLVVRNSTDIEM